MTMKISAEEIFEKDQPVDEALLAKIGVYRNRLRVAFGAAVTLLLLAPELTNIDSPIAPLLLTFLLVWGVGQAIYLRFSRKWRPVPMTEKREVIVWSLGLGMTIFAFLPIMAMFDGDPEVFPAFIVIGVLGYGLYWLNKRWSRSAESEDDLFP